MGRYRTDFSKDNTGVSLIELLVVIAILAVVAGGTALGISLVFSKDAENCANKLNDAITEARTVAMSKEGSFVLTVTTVDGMYKAIITNNEDASYKKEFNLEGDGSKRISAIKCNTQMADISDSSPVKIVFHKTKGNVYSIADDTNYTNELIVFDISPQRGNRTAKVQIVTGTGKHTIGDF